MNSADYRRQRRAIHALERLSKITTREMHEQLAALERRHYGDNEEPANDPRAMGRQRDEQHRVRGW